MNAEEQNVTTPSSLTQPTPKKTAQSLTATQVLFSFTGRICRRTFWIAWLGLMAVSLIIGLIIHTIASKCGKEVSEVFYLLYLIPAVYTGLAIQIKRWHDINISGWILVLAFVPFLNFLYLLFAIVGLFFIKGTTDWNNYGPDPLQKEV